MSSSADCIQLLTWQDFTEFWEALEASHEQTPYTFDAYDEEVARIAFKAGRESMRRQVVALIEHMVESGAGAHAQAPVTEVGCAVLREIVGDVDELVRAEDN